MATEGEQRRSGIRVLDPLNSGKFVCPLAPATIILAQEKKRKPFD